jgi:murein DD-endopeptidase MepM/ murein hydrolase activator NlpD
MDMSLSSPLRRISWAVTVSAALGLSPGVLDTPGYSADINEQVAETSDDLARADAKVEEAIRKLDSAREQLPQARQELSTAQSELTAAQQRKSDADVRVAESIAKVAKSKQRIAETEQEIAYLEQQIGQMAREVYQQGAAGASEMEILLDSHDPGDFASRLETLRSIAEGNNTTLSDLDAAKARLTARLAGLKVLETKAEQAQAEAQKEVQAAFDAKARADAAKARIDELVASRASALRDAKDRKQSVKKQYEQLRAEQERIAAIARAAAAKAAGGGSVPASIGPSGLAWPVVGAPVSGDVGPRVHPVYGYRSCHTGADISAGQGTPIQVAAPGVVVSIENGGPYGLHTVVQHGDGVSTMYAHQSSTSVDVGQKVKRGDVIGSVGSTGWSTGPHLHFEVHVDGVPHDPMGWFGGSRTPVSC